LFIHSQKAIFESIKKPQKDLSDKIIAITGCTSGLGKEIINPLLDRGATVILLNRISEKSKSLYEELKDKNIVDIECDLTSLKSVNTACKKIRDEFPQGIDVLYINAGISNNPVTLTEDNYEIHIQTNYISHVLLINNVLDLLKKKNGKIINTSSIAYKIPFFTYNPLVFKKHPYIRDIHSQYLYQQSKLAMLLYLKNINSEINVINVQPGICSTELLHNSILSYPIKFLVNLISSSSKSGSKYLLNALTLNKYHEFVGPTILFMNFNTIDKSLINKIDSNKIYKETHKSLNIKSSKASDKAESSPDSQPRTES
jgi:NAD(P)-dependent dehydrogenase (short-subunit alcohol dehydrogenase family)